ncbi:UNVERIFIED_CONTAM: hypothetical protein PYX00_002697 [Menopon gallinae]|uniref:RING-type domain-containing protein n=1 Tax=Menopon gallinae TaxID=328185 RepID=A0AAW2HX30_9NEOP
MQTSPCGHRVVCRKCFVKTIQMAVSQRLLPLRCVICRAKILRLKQSSGHSLGYSKSWLMPSSASSYSMSARSWSASSCKSGSWANRSVPNSASLYSMTSGSSSLSGMSSVSSTTNSSAGSRSSSTTAPGRLGTVRQPTGSLRKSQQYSMKAFPSIFQIRIQEYNDARHGNQADKPTRLPPIIEFQREYRLGKERASSSTRIRCAQKIVTQLETTPLQSDKAWKKPSTSSAAAASSSSSNSTFFRSPLRPANKEERKRDKSEDKRIVKLRDESAKRSSEKGAAGEAKEKKQDKKEAKAEKKKSKKEADKKDEVSKGEKKEVKCEKKAVNKEMKNDKTDAKVEKGKN